MGCAPGSTSVAPCSSAVCGMFQPLQWNMGATSSQTCRSLMLSLSCMARHMACRTIARCE
ncbi:hypothetical protein BJF90_24205 [Pseudonocardia sp. CNS-004]|nr:hypothetical protein BJF90_24205 [Pseudonocardia sp. CNS-004]